MNKKAMAIICIVVILPSINITGCLKESKPPPPHIDESWITIPDDDGFYWGGSISIAWNPSGTNIASSAEGINIWNTTTWQEEILLSPNNAVGMVTWNTDGSKLASSSLDGNIRIWNASTWQVDKILLENGTYFYPLSWNHDGFILAAVFYKEIYKVRFWDSETWEILHDINESSSVESISWSPNGEEIALSVNNFIKIYNTETWEMLIELTENINYIKYISYSPDRTKIASMSVDGIVKIWNTSNWKSIKSISDPYGSYDKLAWSPNGKHLAIWSNFTIVDIWNTSTWQIVQQLKGHTKDTIDLTWSPDGTKIATGADVIKIWNVSS